MADRLGSQIAAGKMWPCANRFEEGSSYFVYICQLFSLPTTCDPQPQVNRRSRLDERICCSPLAGRVFLAR